MATTPPITPQEITKLRTVLGRDIDRQREAGVPREDDIALYDRLGALRERAIREQQTRQLLQTFVDMTAEEPPEEPDEP